MKAFWLTTLIALAVIFGAVYLIHLQTIKYAREHPELIEEAKRQAVETALVDK